MCSVCRDVVFTGWDPHIYSSSPCFRPALPSRLLSQHIESRLRVIILLGTNTALNSSPLCCIGPVVAETCRSMCDWRYVNHQLHSHTSPYPAPFSSIHLGLISTYPSHPHKYQVEHECVNDPEWLEVNDYSSRQPTIGSGEPDNVLVRSVCLLYILYCLLSHSPNKLRTGFRLVLFGSVLYLLTMAGPTSRAYFFCIFSTCCETQHALYRLPIRYFSSERRKT